MYLQRSINLLLNSTVRPVTIEPCPPNSEIQTLQGPAVWALRAQTDKIEYSTVMRRVLEATPNLFMREGMAVDLDIGPNDEVSMVWGCMLRMVLVTGADSCSVFTCAVLNCAILSCVGSQLLGGREGCILILTQLACGYLWTLFRAASADPGRADVLRHHLPLPRGGRDHWHFHERLHLGRTPVYARRQVRLGAVPAPVIRLDC